MTEALDIVDRPDTKAVLLAQAVDFDPEQRVLSLSQLPEACGVLALFSGDAKDEPYLARASHLRRRLQRFLSPAPSQSRRLQLAAHIRRIEYTTTGSDFASDLVLYNAASALERMHGGKARDARTRLRLRPATFLKVLVENRFPRAVVSTRLSRADLVRKDDPADQPIGPFPSRLGAERYLEEVLDLFLLRRCMPNLDPDPAFPGCIYSEMKKCLAPCFAGCTDERYAEEASAVKNFLATRGRSELEKIAAERTAAAESLEFEQAASLHQRYEKVKAVAGQMPEAARPLDQLSGIIVQPGAIPDQVDLFRLERGSIAGPVAYSTIGMRLHNELSGSSSLYTQPMALEPVPLGETAAPSARDHKDMLEQRLDAALSELSGDATNTRTMSDHLSLFARWFYRPQTRRVGEILFLDGGVEVPRRALLRAISRVAAAQQYGPAAPDAKPRRWHA